MGEYTVTLEEADEKALISHYGSVEDGLLFMVNREMKRLLKNLIKESSSALDPDKLDLAAKRSEVMKNQADIKEYAKRKEV